MFFTKKLQEIGFINYQLKTARADKIRLLHSLIFDFDMDKGRDNRKALRDFKGYFSSHLIVNNLQRN